MAEELAKAEVNRKHAAELKAVTSVATPNLKPFETKNNQAKLEVPYIKNMEEFKAVHETFLKRQAMTRSLWLTSQPLGARLVSI